MAERTSVSLNTMKKKIPDRLKEVIEYNGYIVNNCNSYEITWIMALSVKSFTHKQFLPT
ncbi:hypothetical protein ABH897_004173 [Paenibacillus sp. RC73]